MGAYLEGITCSALPQLGNQTVEISFPPEDGGNFAHLLLTGPNGSGKTTLLSQTADALRKDIKGFDVLLDVSEPKPMLHWGTLGWDSIKSRFLQGKFISAYLGAMRNLQLIRPEGPKKFDLMPTLPRESLASQFLQYLVNRKAEQGFASVDKNQEKVDALQSWFDNLLHHLRELFGEPELALKFASQEFNFYLEHPDGRRYDFTQLADGYAAVLSIYAELLLRLEGASQTSSTDLNEISGIVLIDELETHLHVELQERILPFLAGVFPRIQFIIATHSPIILSSVDNAVIYDLATKRTSRSKDYRAIPYGALMKGHFGIESDFDLASTQQLHELQALNAKDSRTSEEEERLRSLAQTLLSTGHPSVLEVWNRLQFAHLYTHQPAQTASSKHD